MNVLGFSFAMSGLDRLDADAWQAIVLCGLARHEEGLIVCSHELEIVFSTTRGASLLSRFGATPGVLPESLAKLVRQAETSPSERIAPDAGRAIRVHVAELRNVTPACVALWLSEEV